MNLQCSPVMAHEPLKLIIVIWSALLMFIIIYAVFLQTVKMVPGTADYIILSETNAKAIICKC